MMRFLFVHCVLSLMQMTFAVDVDYQMYARKYTCVPTNLETKTPGTVITEYNGKHLVGRKDSDVLAFIIYYQKTDYLPRGMSSKYVNLNSFTVQFSGVKSITRDDFKAMPKLKIVILSENAIETIPGKCFDDLILLEVLSLSSNKIKFLPNKVFHAFPNLEEINLSNNSLAALPADLFEKNPKLKFISFQENKLKFIGSSILTNQKNLRKVEFHKNICINEDYPKTSIDNLVKIFKSKCNVDECIVINNNIAKLEESNKKLEEQHRANEIEKNKLRTTCPDTQSLSIESTLSQTDDLQQKYDELKKSYDELASSKSCLCKNGSSQIELIFHHKS